MGPVCDFRCICFPEGVALPERAIHAHEMHTLAARGPWAIPVWLWNWWLLRFGILCIPSPCFVCRTSVLIHVICVHWGPWLWLRQWSTLWVRAAFWTWYLVSCVGQARVGSSSLLCSCWLTMFSFALIVVCFVLGSIVHMLCIGYLWGGPHRSLFYPLHGAVVSVDYNLGSCS